MKGRNKMNLKIDTKKLILDTAENLLLDLGYNGFSYKDIADALSIRNASIHYHFPQKTDLGVAIIQRAQKRFEKWTELMADKNINYSKKLNEFFLIFKKYVDCGEQVCLGGALETDFKTLPDEMQKETRIFISLIRQWLESLLTGGRSKKEFKFSGTPKNQALLIMSSLQGAIQIVRVTSPSSFDEVTKQIKHQVCV
jgi:TetR/AcrR family transcriptional regulator, transcriptional repressor for nem operon